MLFNNSLKRLTDVLDSTGFVVKAFTQEKPWEQGSEIRLALVHYPEEDNKNVNCSCSQSAGADMPIYEGRAFNERYGLHRLLGLTRGNTYHDVLKKVQELIREGNSSLLNEGDFFLADFEVPAAEHKGVKFKALQVNALIHVIDVKQDKVVFGFDDILFLSPINKNDTNKGGFKESALAEYLNNTFLDAFGISDYLLPSHDELDITLPTATEMFGEDEDYAENTANYSEEPEQLYYFKSIKNRIKVYDDDTHWYWLSSPRAHSSADFCRVHASGNSNTNDASSVGGVAPVFCVA